MPWHNACVPTIATTCTFNPQSFVRKETVMENQESQTAGAATGGVIDKVKSEASGVAEDVKRQGQEQFEARKHTAADQTEKLAGVVDRVAGELKDQDQQSLADY